MFSITGFRAARRLISRPLATTCYLSASERLLRNPLDRLATRGSRECILRRTQLASHPLRPLTTDLADHRIVPLSQSIWRRQIVEKQGQGDALPKDDPAQARAFLLQRYKESIEFYWRASRKNKNGYKITRYLTVLLGSLVTLISSLSAAEFIKSSPAWALGFSIMTPVFAATLAIVGGFSQAFQWGPTWRRWCLRPRN